MMADEFAATRDFWADAVTRVNLMWPDTHIIRFVKRNFREPDNTTILDFGAGGGRNSIALLREGYRVIAMDYTDKALDLISSKIPHDLKDRITLIQNDDSGVAHLQEQVDAAIASGSMFYNDHAYTTKLLEGIKDALRPNGLFWADWRTKDDSLCANGIRIDNGLYKLGDGTKREGCLYLFVDKADITRLYQAAGLKIVSIDTYDYTENNGHSRCSYLHVTASK